MKNAKFTGASKGSITVEASIIVPIVILAITAIMYMSLLWFHHACIKSAADKAVERGAGSWNNQTMDIQTGKIYKSSMDEKDLYWRIADRDMEDKIQKIEQYVYDELEKHCLLVPVDQRIGVEIKEYIIYKKLVVSIENSYKIPAAGFLRIFGFNDVYVIQAKSEAVIDDTVEFMRNTDFIIDTERELENRYPGIKDLSEKARSALDAVKEKMYEFID